MKTNSNFNLFFMSLFVMALSFTSCGSDDGGDSEGATSITLTSNAASGLIGTQFNFTVKDNNNSNVTASSTFMANGTAITNPHTFLTEGLYLVVANNNSLTSDAVSITVTAPPVATSIILTASETEVNLNDSVTFTVEDDLGNDVTDIATYTVNGGAATSPYVFSTAGGVYNVIASYQGLTSDVVDVTVTAPSAFSDSSSFSASGALTSFTKKALLEDFTGTWCPNCPPAAAAIASARSANSNVLGVGYHDGDPMQITETSFWQGYYHVTGFPTVYVNGPDTRWNFPDMGQVNTELAENAELGLAVEANLVGGKLDLEVQVGYASAIGEEIKLMIYLVEDNVTSSSAQAGSGQGTGYVHKDVLREVYTDQLGDVISTSNIGTGGVFTRTITGLDLPSTIDDMSELKVIAYVCNTYTKTFTDYFGDIWSNSPHYDIYNVQEAHMGTNVDFD